MNYNIYYFNAIKKLILLLANILESKLSFKKLLNAPESQT
jgi:hypothetical protein